MSRANSESVCLSVTVNPSVCREHLHLSLPAYAMLRVRLSDVAISAVILFNVLLFTNTDTINNGTSNTVTDEKEAENKTTPFKIYIGYTNNPWGESTELGEFTQSRPKRSVIHLYNMVVCATGCNPLAYKGYGCYCGFLGSGYSMDPIDRCCKMHDWCYSTADCPMFLEYFVPYVWTCYRRRPLCALGASCGQRLCECDRQLAECLSRFPCPRSKAVCTSSPWRLLQNLLML